MTERSEGISPLTVSEIGPELLPALHPLWLALHRYHGEIGSQPLVSDEGAAWARREALYRGWLEAGEAFVLLARRGEAAAGYAVVHLQDGPDDTFPLGARWAEIYSLSVAPAARGQGIGTMLLDAIDARLAALGIQDISVAAMVENEAALRLYRSRGFVPREVVLYRLGATEQP